MKNYLKFSNQSGFTLPEVLASLALLSLVALLGMGFLMNGNDNKETIASAIALQQKSNLMLTSMQSAYYKGEGTGDLFFREPDSGVTIERIAVNGVDQSLAAPLTNINFDEPLQLDVTTVSDDGKKLTLQTAWRPHTNHKLSLNP